MAPRTGLKEKGQSSAVFWQQDCAARLAHAVDNSLEGCVSGLLSPWVWQVTPAGKAQPRGCL